MTKPFFAATRRYRDENTELFDFVAPALCSFWNTRQAVRGFQQAFPDAHRNDFQSRFVLGSQIQGVNVEKAFIAREADHETRALARTTLYSSFALYEGYLNEIARQFPRPKTREKELQFPSQGHPLTNGSGIREALAAMKAQGSAPMLLAFHPPAMRSPKYALATIDELLCIYRYYKEVRNCLTHSRGTANLRLEEASLEVSKLTAKSAGVKSLPPTPSFQVGDEVDVSLSGVIGFTDILLRIVTTIDTELLTTSVAEGEFIARWDSRYPQRRILAAEPGRRHRQLTSLCNLLGFTDPADTTGLYQLLKDGGRVY